MRTARRSGSSGFTLLEVMVAFAILSLTLVVMLGIVTNNVRATVHARMTTTATFLVRGKMVDVEDDILYNGFTSDNEINTGTFKADNFPEYRWETVIERVELPVDLGQKTKDQALSKAQDSAGKDPMSMMTGFLGGMMSSFIDPIRIGLQESVRRVTVRVFWDEPGRVEQMVEVIQYLTDPAKLDMALTGGAGAAAPAGTGGAPGSTTPGLPPGLGIPNVPSKAPGQR